MCGENSPKERAALLFLQVFFGVLHFEAAKMEIVQNVQKNKHLCEIVPIAKRNIA